MTRTQFGVFLFVAALMAITATLFGDIYWLIQSGSKPDFAFVTGVLTHIGAVTGAFAGGWIIPTGQRSAENQLSDQARADLARKVGV